MRERGKDDNKKIGTKLLSATARSRGLATCTLSLLFGHTKQNLPLMPTCWISNDLSCWAFNKKWDRRRRAVNLLLLAFYRSLLVKRVELQVLPGSGSCCCCCPVTSAAATAALVPQMEDSARESNLRRLFSSQPPPPRWICCWSC